MKGALLRTSEAEGKNRGRVDSRSESRRLVQELRSRQLELDVQGHELNETKRLLQLSRDRYADLYDFAPVGYVTLDAKGRVHELNLTAARILGVERTRLVGLPFAKHVHRDDKSALRNHLKSLTDATPHAATELRLIVKGGGCIHVKLTSSKILVPEGGRKSWLYQTAFTDISARKQAQESLRESAELNHGILSSLSANIAVLDHAGNIIAVNEAWDSFSQDNGESSRTRTGVGANYLMACRQATGAFKQDARRALAGIRKVLKGEAPSFTMEYPCHSPAKHRWFLMSVTPLSAGGHGVVIAHLDISESRLAAEALIEKEARLRAVLETAVDAIITMDEHGVIESINKAGERLFGYAADEVIGRNVSQLMPSPDREQNDGHLANYYRTGKRRNIDAGREASGRRKDGITFPIELAVSEVQLSERRIYTGFVREITERKQGEAAAMRLAAIVESSSDAIIGKDLHGVVNSWNAGAAMMFGFAASEMMGHPINQIIPEDRQNEEPQILTRIKRGERLEHFETVRVRKDGTLIPISLTVSPVKDVEGRVIGASKVARDITGRKRAEEALQTSERLAIERAEELEVLLDATPISIFIAHDPDCLHISGNRAATELLAVPRGTEISLSAPEERRPRHFKALKDGQLLAIEELPAQRAARGIPVRNFEFSLVFDDGTVREIVANAMPLRNQSGQPRGSVLVLVDITERRKAEQALQAREVQLHTFVQQAPVAMAMFDRKMVCLAASQRWISDYGRGHRNIVGLCHYDVHPDLPKSWKRVHRKALAGAHAGSDEDLWVQADGRKVWLRWSVDPWRDAHGEIGGIIIVAEDITERRQLEGELLAIPEREQQRIGHDLHDGLGQQLTALEMKIFLLLQDLSAENFASSRKTLQRQARRLGEQLRECITTTRSIARGLAPVALTSTGLSGALEQLA